MTSPDFAAIRAALYAELVDHVHPSVATYSRGALGGVPGFPAVVVGQPKTDLETSLPCLVEVSVPVAVVVDRPGADDQYAIDLLDELLTALLDRLDVISRGDLNGAVNQLRVTRTFFTAAFPIGGQGFPAHTAVLTIHA